MASPVRSALLLAVFCSADAALDSVADECPYPGWANHRMTVVKKPEHSLVNASHPDMTREQNYFGFEGGAAVKMDGTYYLVLTEFYAEPRFVPSRFAVWATSSPAGELASSNWTRLSTIFSSTGMVETEACTDPRGSLGSSVSPVYNQELQRWELFYSAFYSCCPTNETVHHFYNRYARQYHARSTVPGPAGISGPYLNLDIVLAPEDEDRQAWEGLMGVDSMSPPYQAEDGRWYAFYGSAKTESGTGEAERCLPTTSNNNTDEERVGLASSPKLEGPWRRVPTGNPVSLEEPNLHTEQPIITRLSDGTYVAVFDALDHETNGSVGYSWSPDGMHWHPKCGQTLDVGGIWGQARTPQGLIEEEDGSFTLFYTGFDVPAEAQDGPHESLGFAVLAFEHQALAL